MGLSRAGLVRHVHSQGWVALGVATVAILAAFTFMAWRDLENRYELAARQGHDTTWFIGRNVSDRFRQYDLELAAIATEAETTGDFNRDSVWQLITLAKQTSPDVRSFGLYNAQGYILQHSDQRGGFPNISVADRDYFQQLRANPEQGTLVTRPFKSRVHGEIIIGLARALRDRDGRFRGVALAAVSPEAFDLLSALPNLPSDSAISIHRNDGINLFRAPLIPELTGQDMVGSPVFSPTTDMHPHGITLSDQDANTKDGTDRLLAYRRLDQWPLVIVVSIPRAQIVGAWQRDWGRNALLVGLALIGFFWLTTIVQRQATGRLEAELALSRQELQHRTIVEAELRRWATTDVLTGIANRRHFMVCAEREWERADRYGRPISVAIFDVDWFKRVNDGFGHAAGDDALRIIVQTTSAGLRETDLLGRLGGEEFGLLLPETDLKGAAELAERLRAAVAGICFQVQGQQVPLHISVGVATHDDEPTLDALIANADRALYCAKNEGRNRVVLAIPTPSQPGPRGIRTA